MKIKIIEQPKDALCAELKTLPYLLDEEQMNSLNGGNSCGVYHQCKSGSSGKSSCNPFDCSGSRTDCTSTRTWVMEELSEL